ncbi:RNase adapter RapZ [Magnetovibrio sp.]|uniref:RNase adapter RapZ n=1 Tax=Magnetovibrio sp. TaxID=2024836 RepID=UPI002F953F94
MTSTDTDPHRPSAPQNSERRHVVLVTGMSGAGKTTVLKAFEDLMFEALDNVPLSLLPNIVAPPHEVLPGFSVPPRPIAVGVDIRTRDFAADAFVRQLDALHTLPDVDVKVLFVDCGDEELVRRYTETRHRHPLAHDLPVLDGIRLERRLISPLLDVADIHLDTTGDTPYDVKSFLAHAFGEGNASGAMAVFVTSFSFRKGLPRDADLVFDVRFLRNPHYDPVLKPLTGRDRRVQAYIQEDAGFDEFFSNLSALLAPMIKRFRDEGKSYLTIAVGCTGGKHRSVFVAEKLAAWLENTHNRIRLAHRDMPQAEPDQGQENGKS